MTVLLRLATLLQLVVEENPLLTVMRIHFIRLKVRTTEINFPMEVDRSVEWMPVLSKTSKTT
jgi:hypothetical protein